jgi:predicted NACHT family NTPase
MGFTKGWLIAEEDTFQALLRRLDLVNYQDDLAKHSETRLVGTCEWSTRHPKIMEWLDSCHSSRLWLNGNPGTGKSTLAAYLVEEAQQRAAPNEAVVYFFGDNKRQDIGKQNSALILKVLIAQLLKIGAIDRKGLNEIIDDVLSKGPNYQFSIRDLTKHLVSLLNSFPKTW